MTREMYETLPLSELKELAKARKLRGVSTLRKSELIDAMLAEDEKEQAEREKSEKEQTEKKKKETEPAKKDQSGKKQPEKRKTEKEYSEKESREPANEDKNPRRRAKKKPAEDETKTEQPENKKEHEKNESEGSAENAARNDENAVRNNENGARSNENVARNNENSARNNENNARSSEGGMKADIQELDSGLVARGILEVMADGYGFIRSDNFLPGENDVYVSPSQIRRFNLKTGDILYGNTRVKSQNEKFSALLYVKSVNGLNPDVSAKRLSFENMTPIFPNERIHLERPGGSLAMRIVDLVSPVGKGQRGMIVSPPKAGKTTLLKDMAKSILKNNPEMHIIILLIDERPEEVTDMKETVKGDNVEVIYSTFDEMPEHHKRVSEMVIERAKRLVENKRDVVIFIDSITRLARAYNQVVPPSGRTLSGGLDPAALHMPKRFFGAARNMREGGSLTILATALVDTGSKMDDVVYEEFKGTGNMELVLDRRLQERRVFPAIDIAKSGTRREDLLLTKEESEAVNRMRRALNGQKAEEAAENILSMFSHSRDNEEVIRIIQKQRW